MIFAASHINEAIENRRKISPEIAFVPHDCLKQIGRGTSGRHYQELAQAIRRLHATSVITNIRQADQPEIGEERGFHWLYGYSLPKRYPPRYITTPDNVAHITPRNPEGEADPARPWVIHIHPWLYNAIVRRGDILAVHPDYFQLTGGLERWLYRLARKAVPDKAAPPAIRFKMETLHARSGVTNDLRYFAFKIRQIAETQPLPEYSIQIEHRKGRRELVTLYRDKAKPCRPPRGRRLRTIRGEHVEPAVNMDAYLEGKDVSVIEPAPEPVTPWDPNDRLLVEIGSTAPERLTEGAKLSTPRPVLDLLLELYRQQLAAAAKAGTSVTLIVPGDEASELRRLLEEAQTSR
jgi:hypothetical protein